MTGWIPIGHFFVTPNDYPLSVQYADLIRDRDKFCQFFVTVVLKNNVSAIKTAPSLQKEADFCNGRCEMIHVYLFSASFTENHLTPYKLRSFGRLLNKF